MTTHSFAVIGGDYRIVMMANELSFKGNQVKVFGFSPDVAFAGSVQREGTLREAVQDAEYIILPLPCTTDGKHVNASLYGEKIPFADLFALLDQSQKLFLGRIDADVDELAQRYGVTYFDYFEREELTVRNAIPAALAVGA